MKKRKELKVYISGFKNGVINGYLFVSRIKLRIEVFCALQYLWLSSTLVLTVDNGIWENEDQVTQSVLSSTNYLLCNLYMDLITVSFQNDLLINDFND